MGAEVFYNRAKGIRASKAFKEQREEACYENGHGGYTGSLAEKGDYTMSKKPSDVEADAWIDMVDEFDMDDKEQKYYSALLSDYKIYDSKWEDALCVPTEDGFIFCGWASS